LCWPRGSSSAPRSVSSVPGCTWAGAAPGGAVPCGARSGTGPGPPRERHRSDRDRGARLVCGNPGAAYRSETSRRHHGAGPLRTGRGGAVTGLSHLGVSSLLSYVIAVLLPAFDALIPVLPSETAVIALGVATAGSADPRAAMLVALAACGAFLGDNAAYLLGRRFGPTAGRRVFAGERGARRRAWAEQSLRRFGARMIIGCRFIPGGRTAVTVTCGIVGYPRRRFVVATAFAAVIWASYAFLIGRIGGKAFEDQPWLGLLLALGITVAVSAAIEAARRARAWHLSSSGSR
jgi:membrane-associated protein